MTSRKPPAKDWRNRPTADWVTATFQQYLKDTHEARYGIAYTTRSYGLEGRWLKTLIADHGAEVVRKFIDACFAEYKPTRDYPGLSFAFMYSYQRGRILPRVLAAGRREELAQAHAESAESLTDWL